MSPQRIQLRRTRGWRKPQGAITVARPTVYGNPFRAGWTHYGPTMFVVHDRDEAVAAFRRWLSVDTLDPLMWDRELVEAHVKIKAALDTDELRGHNLACWCDLSQPCHADVLLEIANDWTYPGEAP